MRNILDEILDGPVSNPEEEEEEERQPLNPLDEILAPKSELLDEAQGDWRRWGEVPQRAIDAGKEWASGGYNPRPTVNVRDPHTGQLRPATEEDHQRIHGGEGPHVPEESFFQNMTANMGEGFVRGALTAADTTLNFPILPGGGSVNNLLGNDDPEQMYEPPDVVQPRQGANFAERIAHHVAGGAGQVATQLPFIAGGVGAARWLGQKALGPLGYAGSKAAQMGATGLGTAGGLAFTDPRNQEPGQLATNFATGAIAQGFSQMGEDVIAAGFRGGSAPSAARQLAGHAVARGGAGVIGAGEEYLQGGTPEEIAASGLLEAAFQGPAGSRAELARAMREMGDVPTPSAEEAPVLNLVRQRLVEQFNMDGSTEPRFNPEEVDTALKIVSYMARSQGVTPDQWLSRHVYDVWGRFPTNKELGVLMRSPEFTLEKIIEKAKEQGFNRIPQGSENFEAYNDGDPLHQELRREREGKSRYDLHAQRIMETERRKTLPSRYQVEGYRGLQDRFRMQDGTDRRMSLVSFGDKADPATIVHEFAHVWQKNLTPEQDQHVRGVFGISQWDRQSMEYFARAFERYLMTGEAANPDMRAAFRHMQEIMEREYPQEVPMSDWKTRQEEMGSPNGKDSPDFWIRSSHMWEGPNPETPRTPEGPRALDPQAVNQGFADLLEGNLYPPPEPPGEPVGAGHGAIEAPAWQTEGQHGTGHLIKPGDPISPSTKPTRFGTGFFYADPERQRQTGINYNYPLEMAKRTAQRLGKDRGFINDVVVNEGKQAGRDYNWPIWENPLNKGLFDNILESGKDLGVDVAGNREITQFRDEGSLNNWVPNSDPQTFIQALIANVESPLVADVGGGKVALSNLINNMRQLSSSMPFPDAESLLQETINRMEPHEAAGALAVVRQIQDVFESAPELAQQYGATPLPMTKGRATPPSLRELYPALTRAGFKHHRSDPGVELEDVESRAHSTATNIMKNAGIRGNTHAEGDSLISSVSYHPEDVRVTGVHEVPESMWQSDGERTGPPLERSHFVDVFHPYTQEWMNRLYFPDYESARRRAMELSQPRGTEEYKPYYVNLYERGRLVFGDKRVKWNVPENPKYPEGGIDKAEEDLPMWQKDNVYRGQKEGGGPRWQPKGGYGYQFTSDEELAKFFEVNHPGKKDYFPDNRPEEKRLYEEMVRDVVGPENQIPGRDGWGRIDDYGTERDTPYQSEKARQEERLSEIDRMLRDMGAQPVDPSQANPEDGDTLNPPDGDWEDGNWAPEGTNAVKRYTLFKGKEDGKDYYVPDWEEGANPRIANDAIKAVYRWVDRNAFPEDPYHPARGNAMADLEALSRYMGEKVKGHEPPRLSYGSLYERLSRVVHMAATGNEQRLRHDDPATRLLSKRYGPLVSKFFKEAGVSGFQYSNPDGARGYSIFDPKDAEFEDAALFQSDRRGRDWKNWNQRSWAIEEKYPKAQSYHGVMTVDLRPEAAFRDNVRKTAIGSFPVFGENPSQVFAGLKPGDVAGAATVRPKPDAKLISLEGPVHEADMWSLVGRVGGREPGFNQILNKTTERLFGKTLGTVYHSSLREDLANALRRRAGIEFERLNAPSPGTPRYGIFGGPGAPQIGLVPGHGAPLSLVWSDNAPHHTQDKELGTIINAPPKVAQDYVTKAARIFDKYIDTGIKAEHDAVKRIAEVSYWGDKGVKRGTDARSTLRNMVEWAYNQDPGNRGRRLIGDLASGTESKLLHVMLTTTDLLNEFEGYLSFNYPLDKLVRHVRAMAPQVRKGILDAPGYVFVETKQPKRSKLKTSDVADALVKATLSHLGVDGVYTGKPENMSLIVVNPEAFEVENVAGEEDLELFQTDRRGFEEEGFTSRLEEVIEKHMGKKPLPADEVLRVLAANGVKKGELRWTGALRWLKRKAEADKDFLKTDPADPKKNWVRKNELLDFIRKGRVDDIEVSEVTHPRYSEYRTPGTWDYKEFLFSLPHEKFARKVKSGHWPNDGVFVHLRMSAASSEPVKNRAMSYEEYLDDRLDSEYQARADMIQEDIDRLEEELRDLENADEENDYSDRESREIVEIESQLDTLRGQLDSVWDDIRDYFDEDEVRSDYEDYLSSFSERHGNGDVAVIEEIQSDAYQGARVASSIDINNWRPSMSKEDMEMARRFAEIVGHMPRFLEDPALTADRSFGREIEGTESRRELIERMLPPEIYRWAKRKARKVADEYAAYEQKVAGIYDGEPDFKSKPPFFDERTELAVKKALMLAKKSGAKYIAVANSDEQVRRYIRDYKDMYENLYDRQIPRMLTKLLKKEPMRYSSVHTAAGDHPFLIWELDTAKEEGYPLWQADRRDGAAGDDFLDPKRAVEDLFGPMPPEADKIEARDYSRFGQRNLSYSGRELFGQLVKKFASEGTGPEEKVTAEELVSTLTGLVGDTDFVQRVVLPALPKTMPGKVEFRAGIELAKLYRGKVGVLNGQYAEILRRRAAGHAVDEQAELVFRRAARETGRDLELILAHLSPARDQYERNVIYSRVMLEPVLKMDNPEEMATALQTMIEVQRLFPVDPKTEMAQIRPLVDSWVAARESGSPGAMKEASDAMTFWAASAVKVDWDKSLSDAIRGGLLANLRTATRNLTGNVGKAVAMEVEGFVGELVDRQFAKTTGKRTYAGVEVWKYKDLIKKSGLEAWDEAKLIWRRGYGDMGSPGSDRFDFHREQVTGRGKGETAKDRSFANRAWDNYVNFLFRFQSIQDVYFRQYHFNRSLWLQSKLKALEEISAGRVPETELKARAEHWEQHPSDDMVVQAMEDAEIATFTSKHGHGAKIANAANQMISGMRSQGIFGSRNLGRAAAFAADRIVPFKTAPTNIVADLIGYARDGMWGPVKVPYSVLMAKMGRLNHLSEDQQRAIAHLAGRGNVGGAMILAGFGLAMAEVLEGADNDPDEREALDAIGRPEGSLLVPGGYSLQVTDLSSPISNLAIFGATLQREVMRPTDTDKSKLDTAFRIASKSIMGAAMDNPFSVGFRNILNISRSEDWVHRLGHEVAGQMLPPALDMVNSLTDEHRRDTSYKKGMSIPGAFNHGLMGRAPGYGDQYPAYMNSFGEKQEARFIDSILPTFHKEDRRDELPAAELLYDIRGGALRPRRDEGETIPDFHKRGELSGHIGKLYLNALAKSEGFRQLNPKMQRHFADKFLEKANRIGGKVSMSKMLADMETRLKDRGIETADLQSLKRRMVR